MARHISVLPYDTARLGVINARAFQRHQSKSTRVNSIAEAVGWSARKTASSAIAFSIKTLFDNHQIKPSGGYFPYVPSDGDFIVVSYYLRSTNSGYSLPFYINGYVESNAPTADKGYRDYVGADKLLPHHSGYDRYEVYFWMSDGDFQVITLGDMARYRYYGDLSCNMTPVS